MHFFIKRPLLAAALFLIALLLFMQKLGVPSVTQRALDTPAMQAVIANKTAADHLTVTGRIEYIEGTGDKVKLRLTDLVIHTRDGDLTGRDLGAWALVRFRIYVYPDGELPAGIHAGEYVRVRGKMQRAQEPECPGEFDVRSYYRARNILFALQNAKITGYAGRMSLERIMEMIAGRLNEGLYRILPEGDAQVAAAIILGQRRELDQDEEQLFKEGGISHILAISGLHINVLAMALYEFFRRRRFSFTLSSLLSGGVIFLYCLMTGMSISAQRALIMFLIWCLSQILGRTSDALSSLSAASLIIFLRYPYALTDAGFLLSFGCLASLELFAGKIEAALKHIKLMPVSVRKNFAAGLSVQIGMIPVMCRLFYQITPWSVLVNLVVLPLLPGLLGAGLIGSVIGMMFPQAGVFAGAPCHYIVYIFECACRLERLLPCSVLITGCPPLWQCAVYYILIGMFLLGLQKKKYQSCRATSFLLLASAIAIVLLRSDPGVEFVFTAVGQGDGILIRSGYHAYLVDCGSSTVTSVWKYKMEQTLKYYGISRLDFVFLTHADSDHINGISQMLTDYELNPFGENVGGVTIGTIAVPAAALENTEEDNGLYKILKQAKAFHIPAKKVSAGDMLDDGRIKMLVLYPRVQPISLERNENSLVLMAQTDRIKVLLTGDLENAGEEGLTQMYGKDLKADVLKCGHHGSKDASGDTLLDYVKPSLAIISCGKGNRYHHPAKEVLRRLRERGIQYHRTDKEGTIIVKG